MRRARPLPALVIPLRLTLSPVELSEGVRPRYPISSRGFEIGRDHRYCLADRLLQTLHAFAFLAHTIQKPFKCHTLLAMLELLRSEPLHMGRAPSRLARIKAPEPQHQRGNLLALALQILLRSLTGRGEVAHGLMPLVGYPDRSQFAGARQPG